MPKQAKNVLSLALAFVLVFEMCSVTQIAEYFVSNAYAQEELKANPAEEDQQALSENKEDKHQSQTKLEDDKNSDSQKESSSEQKPTQAKTKSEKSTKALPDNQVEVNGFVFDVKTQTIIKCNAIKETMEIPGFFEVSGARIAVKHIAADAFKHKTGVKIKNLTLPEGIETLGKTSFAFNNIQSLTLPKSLKVIEEGAFEGNNLAEKNALVVPENSKLKSIGKLAFDSCDLESLDLSKAANLQTISESAFSHNYIATIKLPENIKTIGNGICF